MTLRIGLMSDLHLEVDRKRGNLLADPPPGHPVVGPLLEPLRNAVDLMVLAGDIDNGTEAIAYADKVAQFLAVPVVSIAGNHEFYHHVQPELLTALADAAAATAGRVTFLENQTADFQIDGRTLHILGCTLWTDLDLYGEAAGIALRQDARFLGIYDYHRISMKPGEVIVPDDPVRWHRVSRQWLSSAPSLPGATEIVITHHAISERSVAERFHGSPLNAAFVSDLEAVAEQRQPALWIHGHTHYNIDYQLGSTHVVSCQRGYPGELPGTFAPRVFTV